MMASAKRGFGFWYELLMNCIYTAAPIVLVWMGLTGNIWTKIQGKHTPPPTSSDRVFIVLFGLGLEIALFFYWRKWWQENAPRP